MPAFDYDYKLALAALLIERSRSMNRRAWPGVRLAESILKLTEKNADEVAEEYGLGTADPWTVIRNTYEEGPLSRRGWLKTGAARSCARLLSEYARRETVLCVSDGSLPVAVELSAMENPVRVTCESCGDELFTLIISLAGLLTMKEIPLRPAGSESRCCAAFFALEYNGRATDDTDAPGGLIDIVRNHGGQFNIAACSSTLLWQTTRDAEKFREFVVNEQRLCSVLILPFAAASPAASPASFAPPALMLLSERGKSRSAAFHDHSGLRLRPAESLAWEIPFRELAMKIAPQNESARVRPVADIILDEAAKDSHFDPFPFETYRNIIANGYLLEAKRYAQPLKVDLSRITEGAEPLSQIAAITRALMVQQEETGVAWHEVALQDIDRFGFVCTAKKIVRTRSEKGMRRARQAALKPGDIILSVKGGAGTVGFAADPEPDTIAGQQFVIVRVKPERAAAYPPYYLFRYLKSAVVREFLDSRMLGGKLPLLKMNDIETLPVITPHPVTLKEQARQHDAQLKARTEILALERTIEKTEMSASVFELAKYKFSGLE